MLNDRHGQVSHLYEVGITLHSLLLNSELLRHNIPDLLQDIPIATPSEQRVALATPQKSSSA